MKNYSIVFFLLFCFLHASSQSGLRVAKKEGIGILLVDWHKVIDTPVIYHPTDNRFFSLEHFTAYICLEKNKQGYLLKSVYESGNNKVDSSVFQLKSKHRNAVKLISWDEYWKRVIADVFNPGKYDYYKKLRLSVARADSVKYRILSAPNDSAKPVRCQGFIFRDYGCTKITGIKGEWLEISISMFDDCSEGVVYKEIKEHPEKYKNDDVDSEEIYRKIIAEKCFDKGWVRWRKGDECFLFPLLLGGEGW